MGAVPGVYYVGGGNIQGGTPYLQGGNANIQGSSPILQGSAPNLQVTFNPQTGAGGTLGTASQTSDGGAYDTPTGWAQSAGYYQAIADINSQIAKLNERETGYRGQAEDYYNVNRGVLQSGYNVGQTNLARSREKVDLNKSQSLRDLAQNIRNAFQSNQIQIGNRGAGDSSAGNMLKFALGRLQTENRGEVLNQTNQQYRDIQLKQDELQASFGNQIAQLDQWKRQRLFEIADKFQQERDYLEQQKTSATQSQQAAITAQQEAARVAAVGGLSQLQNDYASAANQIAQQFGTTNYDVANVNRANVSPNSTIDFRAANTIQQALYSPFRRKDSQLPY